ncbi:unnamed protein product [Lactuca saligna]|uniref:Uncharacterized protein n=1 Tax=Lactuca saligna TaxID=75948 RepID=A0AA35YNK3_LACSI|nr:unnamed protein product [Lactuca saligna]
MLKRTDPSNFVLVSYLATIYTSVETGILLPQPSEKKSKKTKKPVVGSSDTKAKSSKKTKSVPVIEPELDQPKFVVSDTQVIENEIMPSKTGVFKCTKMKLKIKRRSLGTKMVLKTQVSHQGVIFREVPAPVSPSTKKRIDADMAKHISQKKKRKLIISSNSTTDDTEFIPETPEATLIIDSSIVDTLVTQPPKVLFAKTVYVEARTSDITVNISDMGTNVIMGENNSKIADQADIGGGGGSSVSSLEVDSLLKVFESKVTNKFSSMIRDYEGRLLEKVDSVDQSNDLRMTSQRQDFLHEVKELKLVTKERHVLFVQEVKKVREDVNLQIRELREDMQKEVKAVKQDDASVNQRIDIICDAVTRFVKLFESMSPQFTLISEKQDKHFGDLLGLLKELKELFVKPVPSSLITSEYFSHKFLQFEAILHKQLSPLTRISNLLPSMSDAPPVVTGVQGGEMKLDFTKTGEHSKVEGKKISAEKPIVVSAGLVFYTVVTTVPLTKPILKGVVIGEAGGSASKTKTVVTEKALKDTGKGILIEKTKEEKKAEVEAEVEKMRHLQSIMTLRAQDPSNIDKGDPSKQYKYEKIDARFIFDHMYSFEKIPKKSYVVTNSDSSQLDFPMNEMMFIIPQFRAVVKCKDVDEGKKMNEMIQVSWIFQRKVMLLQTLIQVSWIFQ